MEGRDLSSRQTHYVVKDMEIGQPINSDECSETADGIARESKASKTDVAALIWEVCLTPGSRHRLSVYEFAP